MYESFFICITKLHIATSVHLLIYVHVLVYQYVVLYFGWAGGLETIQLYYDLMTVSITIFYYLEINMNLSWLYWYMYYVYTVFFISYNYPLIPPFPLVEVQVALF